MSKKKKKSKFSLRNGLIFIGGAIVQIVILLVLPEILSALYNVDLLETIILFAVLIGMGFIAWGGITLFIYILNREKDSLSDSDKQKVYNEENIPKHERCERYVDVCSVSRALIRPGLQISLDTEEKEYYRLSLPSEVKASIEKAREIYVLSDQFNGLENNDDIVNQTITNMVNEGMICHHLYVGKKNREAEINQIKTRTNNIVEDSLEGNIEFVEFESASSILGNVFTSFVEVLLISKKDDYPGFISEGYLMFYSIYGEECVYYKMPTCLLHNFSHYLKEVKR